MEDIEDLSGFSPDNRITRNAIIFCDAEPVSDSALQAIYDWLCEGHCIEEPYACFIGRHSSKGDDDMDMIMVMNEVKGTTTPDVITTWHDNNRIAEISEIPTVFSAAKSSDQVWVMFGKVKTKFEFDCRKALTASPR